MPVILFAVATLKFLNGGNQPNGYGFGHDTSPFLVDPASPNRPEVRSSERRASSGSNMDRDVQFAHPPRNTCPQTPVIASRS